MENILEKLEEMKMEIKEKEEKKTESREKLND
jgi:hypothetical protein